MRGKEKKEKYRVRKKRGDERGGEIKKRGREEKMMRGRKENRKRGRDEEGKRGK